MTSVASSDESTPPPPNPQNIPAAALNPWQAAAAGGHAANTGKGRGGAARVRAGRSGRSNASDAGDEVAFLGPISLMELEHRHRLTADGAESSLYSDDEEGEQAEHAERHKKRRRVGKPRRRDAGDASEEEEEEDAEDAEDEGEQTRCRRRGATAESEIAMAAAAFGTGAPVVDSADNESEVESSSATGGALIPFQRTFPVRGVVCVGCSAERDIVSKVDDFVKRNSSKMQEDALYRTASVFWKTTVVDPARREGVAIAAWPWKELRSHYQLHVCDPYIQRIDCCRQLASVRKMLELSLVRCEGGQRLMDHKNTDLLLKVIGMQSRELSLLNSNSMPPPPNRPSSRATPEGSGK